MGLIPDPHTDSRRVVWALIFTAVYRRHCYLHLRFRQTTEAGIAACEAAWRFFSGVFAVLPRRSRDNTAAIVDGADVPRAPLQPGLRGVRPGTELRDRPRPGCAPPPTSPRVERVVPFVRSSISPGSASSTSTTPTATPRPGVGVGPAGGSTGPPSAARRSPSPWRSRPACYRCPPTPYDLAIYARAKVHRDHHIEVAKASYSIPGDLIGRYVEVRADAKLVRVSHRGQVVKVHPRLAPGGPAPTPPTC